MTGGGVTEKEKVCAFSYLFSYLFRYQALKNKAFK